MTPERWQQIDELFDAVLDLPAAEREGFLLERCSGDEDLRIEVLSLLKASGGSEDYLERSAMGVAARHLAGEPDGGFETNFIGQTIGTYKIEKPIGAGGMGEVYLAYDEKLKRKVALKILPAEYTSSDERVKRFEMEARAISALNHPNIVTIYDVGGSGSINYIATEFVEGKTLRELVGTNLKLKDVLGIILQICDALAAAHAAGIIHRDIKPENIMVRPDGYVKILDFGLAKLSEIDLQTMRNFTGTAKGIIIGTPAYMSPEQVADDRVDHRTDLWSVGVVLYELLTGTNPFKKENRQATFQAILSQDPPAAGASNAEVPAELDQVLVKALEKDPDLSYQTASDLRADLKRVKREVDSSPSWSRSAGNVSTPSRQAAKAPRFLLFLTFAFLLFTLIGVGSWFFIFRQKAPVALDWTKAQNIQLTDSKGTEYFPSLSPDGKIFAYASDANGNFDIYVQRVNSKKADNLTPETREDDTQPAFSPDGERIAFRSEREQKGIYVMNLSGENVRRVSDFGYHPSWSPDGKEIVVSLFGRDQPTVRADASPGLWIINVETGAKREISKLEASFPAWSPSGKRVAFWFYTGNFARRDIATIPAGGGEPVIIAKDFAVSNWNPVWSPDGKYLYFVSSKGGSMGFWRVAIDEASGEVSGEPEPVGTLSKFSRHLNFSRDGKRMIYVQTNNQANIQGAAFDMKQLKLLSPPGWITQGDREISRAELSPDGSRFVMRVIKRTQDDIVTYGVENHEWRDVTDDASFERYVRWAPDSKQLAFGSDRGQEGGNIWMSNADGTNLRQITFPDARHSNYGFPIFAPDGKRMAINGNSQTYIIDLTKNWNEQTPQPLARADGVTGFVCWDWSPDGKKLGGTIHEGEKRTLGVYDLETGNYQRFFETDGNTVPAWLPDSRHAVYSTGREIFVLDTETGKQRLLTSNFTVQLRSPFVSRKGQMLYFTVHTAESDVWLLDLTQNQ